MKVIQDFIIPLQRSGVLGDWFGRFHDEEIRLCGYTMDERFPELAPLECAILRISSVQQPGMEYFVRLQDFGGHSYTSIVLSRFGVDELYFVYRGIEQFLHRYFQDGAWIFIGAPQ